ncbi:MAG: sigma-70 family RNA polymerase sigma factor, partial [Bacteroidales bacterium]|nr:sigma-70 family RNA polymerase sigma factor [Bacteroidales bacterium]
EGDNAALETIFKAHSKRIYHYGLKITSNRVIIEDSIQEVFSDLFRTRNSLGDTDNIYLYLLKSFKRKLIRLIQKENRFRFFNQDEDFVFDVVYSVEQDIINNEKTNFQLRTLHSALEKLTPRQKEAIYLRFTEEFEYPEIAEMMQMSIEACRNLIFRAIKALKESIEN